VAFLRYVIGAAGLLVATSSIVSGASAVRKRMLPNWAGALGCLVVTVISLALVTVVSELLGSVGLFRVALLTVAFIGAGLGGRFVAHRSSRLANEAIAAQPVAPAALSPRADVWARRVAAAAGLLVVSEWLTATVRSFQIGMTAVDANLVPHADRGAVRAIRFDVESPRHRHDLTHGLLSRGLRAVPRGWEWRSWTPTRCRAC